MPIRMEQDPHQERRKQNNDRNGKSGSGLMKLLPFLLMFLFKRPKLLIPVLIIGGIWYFMFGGQEMFSGGIDNSENAAAFSFGAELSEEEYDKAEVFEPLAATYGSNTLPSSITLSKYAPKRMHQGRQGSCVGWASSYGARTILQARATGQSPDRVAFSPSYLYNQIALPRCQGAYMRDAMETLRQGGVLPYSQFAYDERSCGDTPDTQESRAAQQFRIKGYNRLTLGARNYQPDILGIKQHLAQGAPVVIGMQVGGSFMHQMRGKSVWQPSQRDYKDRSFSGHAMCVIGYDDNKAGGSFEIMNSWGQDWGKNGLAYVRYQDFDYFVKEAYGLYPMGNANAPKYNPDKLAIKFGLVDNATQSLIPLVESGNRVFKTRRPIRKGDKFKVAITNSIECYVYVFGQETDGSSYVLFPYTKQHSPYCGITGTRLFPKDHSMVADAIGNRDRIAVVVSKAELDWNRLNDLINSSRQRNYIDKLRNVIGAEEVVNVKFNAGDAIDFNCSLNGKNVVGMVIEIEK